MSALICHSLDPSLTHSHIHWLTHQRNHVQSLVHFLSHSLIFSGIPPPVGSPHCPFWCIWGSSRIWWSSAPPARLWRSRSWRLSCRSIWSFPLSWHTNTESHVTMWWPTMSTASTFPPEYCRNCIRFELPFVNRGKSWSPIRNVFFLPCWPFMVLLNKHYTVV